MKKAVIVLIAIIVIAGGAYAIFHKPSKSTPNNKTVSSSQSSATAINNSILITKTNSTVGQYLADPSGMTLYTYSADSNGVSKCTGSCLQAWPAYVDKGSTTNLPAGVGTINRTDDGAIQFTYNGMPLYYYVGDSSAGQVTGNGVENFTVAKPATTSASTSSSTSTSSATTASQSSNTSSNSSGGW